MQELLKASFPHISPKDFLPRAFGLSIVCPRLLQPVVLPLDASGKCPNAFPLSSLSGSHWTNPNTQAWFIENSLSVPLALATFTRKSRFYLHVCQESGKWKHMKFKMPQGFLLAIQWLLSSLYFPPVGVSLRPDSRVL